MPPLVLTLCIIRKDGRMLLGLKKKGFGTGNFNGFGGKVEPDESIEDAAKREALEESGIAVSSVKKIAVLSFISETRPEMEMHVFMAQEFSGEAIETDEMVPQWFPEDALPYDRMWATDAFWLPGALAGKKQTGKFIFDAQDKVREHSLTEVDTL